MTVEQIFTEFEGDLTSLNEFAGRLILSLEESNLDAIEARLCRHAVVQQKFERYAARILTGCGWDLQEGTGRMTPAQDMLLQRLRARLAEKRALHATG